MNKLLFIVLILFTGNSMASSLPNCLSNLSPEDLHNCFGSFYSHIGTYEGEWKNGLPHGKGTFTFPDGSKEIGFHINGLKHGKFISIFPNGFKYICYYKDGILQNECEDNNLEKGGK